MNHDATHCLDYDPKTCPSECYRAQLTEELKHRKDLYYLPMSWAHFGETEECLKKKEVGKMSTIDFELHMDMDEIIERLKEQGWRPVKQGRWLHGREVSRDYIGDACVAIHYEKWWCSECNYPVDGRPLWKFCPNCGAKNEVSE